MKKSLTFITIVALYLAFSTNAIAQEYYPDIFIPDEETVVEESTPVNNTILSLTTPPPLPKKREWYSLDGWSGGGKWKENEKAEKNGFGQQAAPLLCALGKGPICVPLYYIWSTKHRLVNQLA